MPVMFNLNERIGFFMSVIDKMLEQIRLEEAARREFLKLLDDNDKKLEDDYDKKLGDIDYKNVEELVLEIIGFQAKAPKKEVKGKKKVSIDIKELKSFIKYQRFILKYLKSMLALEKPVFYEAHINRIRSGLNEINDFAKKYNISLD